MGFFSFLFGSPAPAPEPVISWCPICILPIEDCKCCYVCGAANRLTCACKTVIADAANLELASDVLLPPIEFDGGEE